MFERLEKDDKLVLIDAMKEVNFNKNDIVIKEGEKGDCLYIVESGTFNWVKSGNDGKQVLLKVYVEGEVFGELALIYNCARTATMIANEDNSTVYSLDRITFNHIVSNNTMRRNEKYMKMLANVPILETMDYYERSKILEACRSVEFDEDEWVIQEGEPATEFYILLEGKAYATKYFDNQDEPVKVKDYSPGDYFGERALLKNEKRAASIIAKTDIKCLALDRLSFNKLLGPIEHILKRNMKIYINYIDQ